ncbi:hypothetical protein [Amycolatopsis dongchuanensis]|uniref:Uncharacterized protein n=1 Tax=Amycolatopsis dongchuanensis TaxID=1070866 RepID=A0ABP9Q845_9PSEU
MSWQDELRRLDADLAAGKISLREHRKQREELLAAASGGFAPSPVASPRAQEPPPAWPTAEPQPEPPAPAAPPQPGRSAALLASTVPTSAPSPADSRPTDSMPYPRIHEAPTVVTPAIPHGTLPGLVPPHQPGRQVPPLPTRPERTTGRKPTWLFLALGVLLVAAMIAGATWFLGERNTSTTTQTSAPTAVPAASLEDRLPALPGTPNAANGAMSIARGQELGIYSPQSAQVFTENGANEVVLRGAAQEPTYYLLLVIPARDGGGANAIADYLLQNAVSAGFTRVAGDVRATTGSNGTDRAAGTWYVSGSTVVAIWLWQAPAADQSLLATRMDQTVEAMRRALPPS